MRTSGEGAVPSRKLDVVQRLVMHALVELGGAATARDDAFRPEEHDDDEDDPEDPVLVLGNVDGLVPELEVGTARAEVAVQPSADVVEALEVEIRDEARAEDDADDVAHPAEDDHDEDEHRDLEEELVGVRAAVVARVEGAGDTAE